MSGFDVSGESVHKDTRNTSDQERHSERYPRGIQGGLSGETLLYQLYGIQGVCLDPIHMGDTYDEK